MTEKEWKSLLETYLSPGRVANEALQGVVDHIETPCRKGFTQTVFTPSIATIEAEKLPPFRQELVTCDRGTLGCNLIHNDLMALRFARLALERVQDLGRGDDPLPELEPVTVTTDD